MAEKFQQQGHSTAKFTLSAFGDEISTDLDVQLKVLRELGIGHLELRSVWNTNVLKLDDTQVSALKHACDINSVRISCIGSPIGKSPIGDPIEQELLNLHRALQVAKVLDTNMIRIFSFYLPETSGKRQQESYLDEAIERLSQMAMIAERDEILLLLENEGDLVGDTPERCHAILKEINSPNLRFVWDTANFIPVGVVQPTERGWPLLSPYIASVQIKDALLKDGSICPPGKGDGQVELLLIKLLQFGYRGFLALEPHLAFAGRTSGFSGPEGMKIAASALRELMANVGCVEQSNMA